MLYWGRRVALSPDFRGCWSFCMIGTPFLLSACQYPQPFDTGVMLGVLARAESHRHDFAIAFHRSDHGTKRAAINVSDRLMVFSSQSTSSEVLRRSGTATACQRRC